MTWSALPGVRLRGLPSASRRLIGVFLIGSRHFIANIAAGALKG